jgi:L-threonylcarbamoyladenylate synthase
LHRLRCDGLVAFPTETVWGLAACAESELAVARLRAWKGREVDKPISVLVSGRESLERLGVAVKPDLDELIRAFWPGPLTLVVSCRHRFAPGVGRGDGAVGVRCSSHPVARELAGAAEAQGLGPITATSLNRSGGPSARTWAEARRLCRGEGGGGSGEAEVWVLAASQADAESSADAPSTVLDMTGAEPQVLRWGAVTADRLAPVLESF